MMSATTAFTETPAATPTAGTPSVTGNNTGAAAATDFQNLLAGAVIEGVTAPLVEPLTGPLPGQPIAQLFAPKSPPPVRQPLPTPTVVAAEVSAGEMLELLNQSAALLPESAVAGTDVAMPEELPELQEAPQTEDDALSDWLNITLPFSVLAPQAGSGSGETFAQERGEAEGDGHAAIPGSLQRQAGNPDGLLPLVAPPPAPTTPVVTLERAAAAPGAAAALVAVTAQAAGTPKSEARDGAATGDEWMNAFGDLTSKRGHEVAAAAAPRLMTPVHDARWADALAHRLVMMAREGESVAQLRLIPQDLGPLDIQISVRDGEANVHFGAAHAETRSVLEASMPRLRELLSAQGLQLANASVSHQSSGQGRPERSPAPGAVGAMGDESEAATVNVVSTSLLDIYA